MRIITLRQEKLRNRLGKIRIHYPIAIYKLYKEMGIGMSSLSFFWNNQKGLSDLTLDCIEKYIIKKEKEIWSLPK